MILVCTAAGGSLTLPDTQVTEHQHAPATSPLAPEMPRYEQSLQHSPCQLPPAVPATLLSAHEHQVAGTLAVSLAGCRQDLCSGSIQSTLVQVHCIPGSMQLACDSWRRTLQRAVQVGWVLSMPIRQVEKQGVQYNALDVATSRSQRKSSSYHGSQGDENSSSQEVLHPSTAAR